MSLNNGKPGGLYNPLQKQHIEQIRKPTNFPWFIVFLVFVLTWLVIGIYAIASEPTGSTTSDKKPNDLKYVFEIITSKISNMKSNVVGIFGCVILTAVLIFTYLLLLKGLLTRVLIILSLVFVLLLICSALISIIFVSFNIISLTVPATNSALLLMMVHAIVVIYLSITLHCVKKVKLSIIVEMTKEICRVFFNCFPLLLFAFIIFVLEILVLLFTGVVFISLAGYENAGPLVLFCCFIDIVGGLFIFFFVANIGQMVIYECAARWYWSDNYKKVSTSAIAESIFRTMKYHLGTAVYSATQILPFVHGLCLSCTWNKDPTQEYDNIFIRIVCKIRLVFNIHSVALVQTSIHGYDFTEAARQTYDLILANCTRYIAVIDMFGATLSLGVSFILFINGLIIGIMMQNQPPSSIDNQQFERLILLSLLLFVNELILIPICFTLYTISKAILLCTFEDLKVNDGTVEKPYYMNNDMKKIMILS